MFQYWLVAGCLTLAHSFEALILTLKTNTPAL